MTPAPVRRPPLSDLVIAETVRLLERGGPLDDDRAMRLAFAEQSTHEARLLGRARLLGDRFGLGDAWQRWRALMPVALGLAALVIGLLSWGICSAVVGHDRQINALAALASMLGPHLSSLLVWIIATAFGGATSGASIGAAVSRLSLWLAARLMPGSPAIYGDPLDVGVDGGRHAAMHDEPGHGVRSPTLAPDRLRPVAAAARMVDRRPAIGLMPQALGGLLRRAGLLPWLFGLASHAAWAIGFVLILAGLFMAFSFQSYRLNWETTILGPGFFVGVVRVLGWLPARLGFATPDEASVLSAASPAAAQQWAWWLIGCTVAYGLLPRVALAAVSAAVWRARRPSLRLDLADPYYRRLIARFEAMDVPRVVDGEQAQPSNSATGIIPESAERATSAAIGFELPPETRWPRASPDRSAQESAEHVLRGDVSDPQPLAGHVTADDHGTMRLPVAPSNVNAAHWSERIDGSSAERRRVLDRIARTQPSRLLMVCHADSSPDRGVERFFRDAALHGSRLQLLLVDATGDAGPSRWRDWLAASGLDAVELAGDEAAASRWLGNAEHSGDE